MQRPLFRYTTPQHDGDLQAILALQAANQPRNIQTAELEAQGFVTVEHDLQLLRDMQASAPQVIAKAGSELAGYALVMLPSFADRIPILKPMFEVMSECNWQGKPLAMFRYFVMGQVCVAKNYRGMGVFDGLYEHMAAQYSHQYDLIVTEVSLRNGRSLAAHRRVGFLTLHQYTDPSGENWELICLPLAK